MRESCLVNTECTNKVDNVEHEMGMTELIQALTLGRIWHFCGHIRSTYVQCLHKEVMFIKRFL